MADDQRSSSLTLDQSRIMRFALIGGLLAAALLTAAWAGLSHSDLDPLPAGGDEALPCCPEPDGADTAGIPAGPAGPAGNAGNAGTGPGTPTGSPAGASSPSIATGPAWLFDTSGFPQRWNCGTWTAELGWMHILGDLSIWGAYMAIPVVLGIFVMRGGSPLPAPIWLFIAFIATCGIGHLTESVIFYEPVYRFSGAWKWVIGIISWATVASLVPTVPQVLRWPRLADLNDELRDLNQSLEQQQRHVERANRRLQSTNEELEQFVYGASHDLKSPLVTISGFLTHLERDLHQGKTESLQGHIDRIARSTIRMKACVDDLLEVSRVGHVTAECRDVDLPDAFRRLVMQVRDRLDQAGTRIDSDFEVDTLLVTPSHLDRALLNLVENAMRYGATSEGAATITVGSRRVGDETHVFVRDNGPGVPPEHAERIFDLFQRLSNDGEGTGVGLTVVQRVAAARHGRAWVASEPGRGATFWMSFPDPIPEWRDDMPDAVSTRL